MRKGESGKHRNRLLLFWKNHALGLSGALLLWEPIDKGAYFGLRAVKIPLGLLLILLGGLLLQRTASGVMAMGYTWSLCLTIRASAAARWWHHYPILLRSGSRGVWWAGGRGCM